MGPARLAGAVVFATLALGLVSGGHLYIARRLVLDPALPDPWRTLALGAVALGFALLVLHPIAERALPRRLGRWVAWPSAIWMGAGFVFVVLLGVSDAVLWLGGASASAAALGETDRVAATAATAVGRAALVAAVGLLVVGSALRGGLRPPAIKRVELALPRWPRALDGLRIVQISDIHIGTLLGRRFAAKLVERVNRLEPDVIAVTGDLVDGSVRQLHDEVEPFAGLRARHGVYFVTGNHDHYSGARSWVARVEELGLHPLRNEHISIESNGGGFDLAGVDDHHGSWVGDDGGEDLDRALEGRDPERPVVLLAHDPSTWKRASRRGVDLQLSGHTHGGQIWPFGFLVRLAVPFVAGHYRRGDAQLYVSRGTGFWGPPMRLFAPSEITEIALVRAAPAEA